MLEFPTTRSGWRLDIVGLLAVLGESAMVGHKQPITSSWLCLLPRLIPAPQAMLGFKRPIRLPPQQTLVHTVGAHSGWHQGELKYFANLLQPIAGLRAFEIQEISIGRVEETTLPRAKTYSPLAFLTVGTSLLTLGLLVWSIVIHDGAACLAICFLSLTSSVAGLGSFWTPELIVRRRNTDTPPGDVIVHGRNGSFIIVRCEEHVARELYAATDSCNYRCGPQVFRVCVGMSTFLLMVAVLLLGNCIWVMQAAIGVSYILLNGLYQIAALLPTHWHWDLSRYVVTKQPSRQHNHFQEALWDVMKTTRVVQWARISRAVPESKAWDDWMALAEQHIVDGTEWDPNVGWDQCWQNRKVEEGIM